jgi:hypothetical protein
MKNTISIITGIIFIVIYELVVIFVFDWTGIYRTIGAALVGVVGARVGKYIGEKMENKDKS